MRKARWWASLLVALGVAAVLGGAGAAPANVGLAKEYVVVFNDQSGLPLDADAKVAAAGGTITQRVPELGAVVATSTSSGFDAAMEGTQGVRAVSENAQFDMIPEDINLALDVPLAPPDEMEETHPTEPTGRDPQPMPDRLGDQQWDKMRMNATATGSYAVQRGRPEVRVAVIDTGADVLPFRHPDIAPNLNFALSRSFVGATGGTAGDPDPNSWDDKHGHGSWCLSAVAAPINEAGVSGVAPNVTLVALRVLGETGSGTFLDVAEAIVYAGNQKFDVASMSIGAYINHSEYNALWVLLTRAIEYARMRGVTPVAALANNNFDLSDGAFMRDFVEVPGETPGVIGVSATGYDDKKAFYSNYGVGKVDVSAPGGDTRTQFPPPTYRGAGRVLGAWATENTGAAVVEDVPQCDAAGNCGVYAWVQGTSMATPNAAGVAALIISQYGDFSPDNSQKIHMPPTEVESILQITANNQPCPQPRTVTYPLIEPATARCQGNAGYNGFYGKGIVDALKAVTEYKNR